MTDPDTPMEEIVRAFNWCIDKGMALYWATSEWPPYLIMEAHAVANKLQLIAPITEVNEIRYPGFLMADLRCLVSTI